MMAGPGYGAGMSPSCPTTSPHGGLSAPREIVGNTGRPRCCALARPARLANTVRRPRVDRVAVTDQLHHPGAREHNLKDASIDLPRDSLIVFTGLSGSGKS